MTKKYIFLDLDGTTIDHSTKSIPESTINAIELAKQNGHELFICTGRPPCLFYGIDKKLGIDSYVAANGRYVVYQNEVIHKNTIPTDEISKLVDLMKEEKIDISFEGESYFRRQSTFDNLYIKFSEAFDIEVPELEEDFHLSNDVFQINMYYAEPDYKKYEDVFPKLSFDLSNEYGLDVNLKGGLKESGIKVIMDEKGIQNKDIIAIGDGFNDIGMLQFIETSVAMGNAHDDVKKHASFVTDTVSNDGIYKAFKKLNLI